jgi:DNA-binding CsgD family transcriptional regulator
MAAWPGQAEGLTPRESEVLSLIVSGLSNQDIALRLFLSINSVKTYVRTAYRRMGVRSRSQAILWGIEHGFRVEHGATRHDRP